MAAVDAGSLAGSVITPSGEGRSQSRPSTTGFSIERRTWRNDESRAAGLQPGHRAPDHQLGAAVDDAGRLVRDQDAGVREEGSGDGQRW